VIFLVTMCVKNPTCINSKTLVLDTNFLDQVNRTITEELAKFALVKPIQELKQTFLTKAQKILQNIGLCGSDKVFTSEKVYDDEIDISKMNSALRTGDSEFFDRLCMDAGFTHDLSKVYQDGITIEELDGSEVEAFQNILSQNVGFHDAGLTLLGIKLSQDQEVIVLTDDLKLRKTINDLRKKCKVAFKGVSLTTANLYEMGSLIFLKNLHSCCGVSNDRWRAATFSFVKHQMERYDKGKISQEIYQKHRQYADQCLSQMLADCEGKKQRQERNEYGRLFGVTDE